MKSFFFWQKLLSVAEIFSVTEFSFLWQKCVSLTETQTETCFCDWNLFPKGNFFFERHLCLKEIFFCDINFFSVKEIFSVTKSCCITISNFCAINWFSQLTENHISHGNFSLEIMYKVPKTGYFWQNKFLSQKQVIVS